MLASGTRLVPRDKVIYLPFHWGESCRVPSPLSYPILSSQQEGNIFQDSLCNCTSWREEAVWDWQQWGPLVREAEASNLYLLVECLGCGEGAESGSLCGIIVATFLVPTNPLSLQACSPATPHYSWHLWIKAQARFCCTLSFDVDITRLPSPNPFRALGGCCWGVWKKRSGREYEGEFPFSSCSDLL